MLKVNTWQRTNLEPANDARRALAPLRALRTRTARSNPLFGRLFKLSRSCPQ